MFIVTHDWVYASISVIIFILLYFTDSNFKKLRQVDKYFSSKILFLLLASICIGILVLFFPGFHVLFSLIWGVIVIITLMKINNYIKITEQSL